MLLERSAPTWLAAWWAWPLTPIWQTWMLGDSLRMEWCSLDFPISSAAISEPTWAWALVETLVPTTWVSINHSINLRNLSLILRLIQLTLLDLDQALLHSRKTVSKSWERNPLNLKTMRVRESLRSSSTSQTPKLRIASMKNPNMTWATTLSPSKIQPLN